jgi:redox-sensing transcriptional repressor
VATGRTHRPASRSRGIPEATVARLPLYLRALTGLSERSVPTVSSEELAAAAGVNSAKLRKDFSYLGSYGTRGVGYDVEYLVYQISRELGLTQDWPVVIVGIGNLGAALANYGGFASRGFRVAALIDADPAMAGKPVAGIPVQHSDELEKIVSDNGVSIGVIATPADRADRPGRRRRPQGRPLHRAADPRLPRAAQGRRGGRRPGGAPDRRAAGRIHRAGP